MYPFHDPSHNIIFSYRIYLCTIPFISIIAKKMHNDKTAWFLEEKTKCVSCYNNIHILLQETTLTSRVIDDFYVLSRTFYI